MEPKSINDLNKSFPIGSIVCLKDDFLKREWKIIDKFERSATVVLRSLSETGEVDTGVFTQINVDLTRIEHSTELGKILYE